MPVTIFASRQATDSWRCWPHFAAGAAYATYGRRQITLSLSRHVFGFIRLRDTPLFSPFRHTLQAMSAIALIDYARRHYASAFRHDACCRYGMPPLLTAKSAIRRHFSRRCRLFQISPPPPFFAAFFAAASQRLLTLSRRPPFRHCCRRRTPCRSDASGRQAPLRRCWLRCRFASSFFASPLFARPGYWP